MGAGNLIVESSVWNNSPKKESFEKSQRHIHNNRMCFPNEILVWLGIQLAQCWHMPACQTCARRILWPQLFTSEIEYWLVQSRRWPLIKDGQRKSQMSLTYECLDAWLMHGYCCDQPVETIGWLSLSLRWHVADIVAASPDPQPRDDVLYKDSG